jgi:hypothetical protein
MQPVYGKWEALEMILAEHTSPMLAMGGHLLEAIYFAGPCDTLAHRRYMILVDQVQDNDQFLSPLEEKLE